MSKSLVSYYPGTSLFHRLDPRAKLLFLFVFSIVIFSIQELWLAIFVFLTVCILWITAKLPVSIIWGFAKGLVPVFIFLAVVQAILYPGEIILVEPLIPNFVPWIGGVGNITLEGILFAILLMFRLLSMIVLLPLVSMTTPVQILALGFVKIGFPYQLSYTLTSALNMVPILQSEILSIIDAQKLRAMQTFEKGKLKDKLRSYPALVTPLVIGAMRRAQAMSVAMDSRAFGAFKTRTYIEDVELELEDWIFMFCVVLYSVAIFVIKSKLS
ncbi:MAG: energy-coupling factor transporter transmembrane protein EcfT [Desulfobacteraceae bacterium]|nr:energy-coupling factor transporter transmembrane protein EcfT [Desulfobacteraceae bacterium]